MQLTGLTGHVARNRGALRMLIRVGGVSAGLHPGGADCLWDLLK